MKLDRIDRTRRPAGRPVEEERKCEAVVNEVMEAHQGRTWAEFSEAFRARYGGDDVPDRAYLEALRGAWIKERLGVERYSDVRLKLFQVFEGGGTVSDALDITPHWTFSRAKEAYEDWRAMRPKPSPKPERRTRCGSGVTFGPGTRRDTIWKT